MSTDPMPTAHKLIDVTHDAAVIFARLEAKDTQWVRFPNGVVWGVVGRRLDGETLRLAVAYWDPADLPVDMWAIELPRGGTREVEGAAV